MDEKERERGRQAMANGLVRMGWSVRERGVGESGEQEKKEHKRSVEPEVQSTHKKRVPEMGARAKRR